MHRVTPSIFLPSRYAIDLVVTTAIHRTLCEREQVTSGAPRLTCRRRSARRELPELSQNPQLEALAPVTRGFARESVIRMETSPVSTHATFLRLESKGLLLSRKQLRERTTSEGRFRLHIAIDLFQAFENPSLSSLETCQVHSTTYHVKECSASERAHVANRASRNCVCCIR